MVSDRGSFAKESVLDVAYLTPGKPDAATLLAPPPESGSPEQAADLAAVIAVHNRCTSNDAALALSERKFSILTFTNAIGFSFQPDKFPKLAAFIGCVQTNAEIAVDTAKLIWKRPRPYTLEPSLANGKLETSFSYPSGHSTEATVVALVLAELFPDRREAILRVSQGIGWHRVLIGRHYMTDICAGRVFAQAIVREMKTNPAFQHDFAAARGELAAQ
jgi:acid phosphatase (class A)